MRAAPTNPIKNRGRLAGAVAVAVAVLLAGVTAALLATGGGHAGADPARARADALCSTAHDRLAPLPSLVDADSITTAGPQVVAITLDTARRLLALDASAGRARAIRGYAQHLIRQAALTARLEAAARAGDRPRVIALVAAITANSRSGRRLGATIAPGCGGIVRPSPGAPPPVSAA
jgi:hypothetical protein